MSASATLSQQEFFDELERVLDSNKGSIGTIVDRKLQPIQQQVRTLLERNSRGPGMPGVTDPGAPSRRTLPSTQLHQHTDFSRWLTSPESKSPRASFTAAVPFERKATISGVGIPARYTSLVGPPQPALRLGELLAHIPVTAGGSVVFTREKTFTPGADLVPETTLKPSTALVFENVNSLMQTIATITKASLQSLNDVPALTMWIDSRLSYACLMREEAYLLLDPTIGLMVNAGALDAGYDPGAGATPLDVIGAAISQLQSAGYSVDGIVMHGSDISKTRLLKTTLGNYLWSGPDSEVGTGSMWSIPVVNSPSMAPNNFLVGAFGQSAIVFDREELMVAIRYENEDDFVRNCATFRAEQREALIVALPDGLIKGTFPAGAAQRREQEPPSHRAAK